MANKKQSPFIRIIKYLRPHLLALFFSLFLTILYAAANVYVMPVVKDIGSQLAKKNLFYFSNHVFNAVLLCFIYLFAKYGQFYLMTMVSNKILIQMRKDIYEKLQELSMPFYSKWRVGDIVSRAFSDVEKVHQAIMLSFESLFPCVVTIIAMLGYLFYLNWSLTLLFIVVLPVFVLITLYFSNLIRKLTGQIQRKTADITHLLQENVANMKVLQAFTMEEREMKKYLMQHERNYFSNMKEARLKATQEPLLEFLQFIVIMAITWYGGYQVVMDKMSGPSLLSFFVGIFFLGKHILALAKVQTKTNKSLASAERIFEIIDMEPQIKNSQSPKKLEMIDGKVAFNNVSFSHTGTKAATLNNINIEARPGEIIALVGLSGSGKSTFVDLIPRFYDPDQGSVLIDGIDIREMDLKFLRQNIGIVPQDVILFRGNILENIRYGKLDATDEEIKEAVKKANVWEFVDNMTDGLLTRVGDQGRTLSGGQKQRISIARAILKNPKILILDEATSSLDSSSELLVQEALNKLMENRTTFVVAHRLSTVTHANRILVIDNGKIVEQGTHEELIKKKGHYSNFYQLQIQKHPELL